MSKPVTFSVHGLTFAHVAAIAGILAEAEGVSYEGAQPPAAGPAPAPAAPAAAAPAPAAAAPAPAPAAAAPAPAAPAAAPAAPTPTIDSLDPTTRQNLTNLFAVVLAAGAAGIGMEDLRAKLPGWDKDAHIKPAIQAGVTIDAIGSSGVARGMKYHAKRNAL